MHLRRPLVVLVHGLLGTPLKHSSVESRLSPTHHVYNHGYCSRDDNVDVHASALLAAVRAQLSELRPRPPAIHFVTHSLGGVVLHRAFRHGLADELPLGGHGCRVVLMCPPLRGSMLARTFRAEHLCRAGLPDTLSNALHAIARVILGEGPGSELMMRDAEWFEQQTAWAPPEVETLVVAGAWRGGIINPFVKGVSDGVLALEETFLKRRHRRITVPLSHGSMLHSIVVLDKIINFLNGHCVGELTDGTLLGLR